MRHPEIILHAIVFAVAMFKYVKLSAASSSIKNDKQTKFPMPLVNGWPTKLDQLLIQLEEETNLRDHFQVLNSELKTTVAQLTAENVKQNERLDALQADFEAKINAVLMAQNAQPKKEINLLMDRKNKNSESNTNANMMVDKNEKKSVECYSAPKKWPPSYCRQLAFVGHSSDGIYLIANPDTNKIQTVYCDFGTNPSETLYGNLALKTKSVHFFVQRSSNFDLNNAVIPFDVERLNVGGAMNLATGVFIVPVNGIYHFEFSGLKDSSAAYIHIYLQVNGANIGTSFAGIPNYLALSGISASLHLKVGDQVRLYKATGTLHDNEVDHYTHFSGWLVEEDFMLG